MRLFWIHGVKNIFLPLSHFRGIHSTCQHHGPQKLHSWGFAGQLPSPLDPKRQISEHRSKQEAKPHETIPAFYLPPDTIWVSLNHQAQNNLIKDEGKEKAKQHKHVASPHVPVKCKKEQDRQRKGLMAEYHLLCW